MSAQYKSEEESSGCSCRRICGSLVSLVLAGTAAVVLWHVLGRPSNPKDALDAIKDGLADFTNVLGNLTIDDWMGGFDQDPYVGDNTTFAWKNNGQGLSLELQNALDENWQQEFEAATADWNLSKALFLTVKQVEVDPQCIPVEGVMKVCNGNYGETGWLGINEVRYLQSNRGGNVPLSSVAKMNEYYLNKAEYAKRQYTMCHEQGHGFGLPHTDENHMNADLGNCLDYTNNPENNMHPGDINYDRLESIYLRNANDQGQAENGQQQPGNNGKVRVFVRRHYLWA